jgi:molybdopterin molybdotransferase
LKEAGAEPRIYPIILDTLKDTCSAFKNAFDECDWVLTSGGVSVGDYDFVKAAFEAVGGQSVFWKISMKPGKPFGMGRLNSGNLWFGAPGNPVSGLVSFHLLVAPALRHALGIPVSLALPAWRTGTLGSSVQNPGNRRHFMRGTLDSESRITPLPKQASHRLSSMSGSDLLIDIPPASALGAGSKIRYTFFK